MGNQHARGFFLMMFTVVVIVLLIIGSIGYILWHKQSDHNSAVTSYAQCVQASGSKIEPTSPQACITNGGKQFVNTSANH